MGAIFGYSNHVKGATITANSAALPASNVADDSGSPSVAWQTAAGQVSYTATGGPLIKIVPATLARTWRVIGLFRTNLSPTATVNVALWNNPSTPSLVFSGTYTGVAAGFGQVVFYLTSDVTADFLQITIDDASNTDGFINVPLIFAGPAWLPSRSVGWSSTRGRDVGQTLVQSRGGQDYPTMYWRRRRWNVQLESMSASESWNQADALLRTADTGQNVFFAPDSASAYIQQESIFGRVNQVADISFPYQNADRRRWSAEITERL